QLWRATLAHDQHLDSWPCRAGDIEFDDSGVIQRCELATTHQFFDLALPAGTTVTRGSADKPWSLMLPPGDVEVAIPTLATMVPAGVTLSVASDGRLLRITSGHGQTIVVRGVPLNSMNFYVRGSEVVAALATPFMISGAVEAAGTGVRIDLANGEIALAGSNWWLSQ